MSSALRPYSANAWSSHHSAPLRRCQVFETEIAVPSMATAQDFEFDVRAKSGCGVNVDKVAWETSPAF